MYLITILKADFYIFSPPLPFQEQSMCSKRGYRLEHSNRIRQQFKLLQEPKDRQFVQQALKKLHRLLFWLANLVIKLQLRLAQQKDLELTVKFRFLIFIILFNIQIINLFVYASSRSNHGIPVQSPKLLSKPNL